MPPMVLAWPLDRLTYHSAAREPSEGDVAALAAEMRRGGQYRAVLVNHRDGTVLAGVRTCEAAKRLGWDHVTVTFVNVDEEEAARLVAGAEPSDGYEEGTLSDMLATLTGDWTPPASQAG